MKKPMMADVGPIIEWLLEQRRIEIGSKNYNVEKDVMMAITIQHLEGACTDYEIKLAQSDKESE